MIILFMTHTFKDKTNKPNSDSESLVIDFGNRAISNQNFSKVVALPKTALENCGNPTSLNVKLVQENGVKFLKLTPIKSKGDIT